MTHEPSTIESLQILEGGKQSGKIIELKEARLHYEETHCTHTRIIVDPELYDVACQDCGLRMNPVAVLIRYAREETRLMQRYHKLKPLLDELAQRKRTRCEHCHKITTISGW